MDQEDAVTNLRDLLATLERANSTQSRISSLQNLQQFLFEERDEESQSTLLVHVHDEIVDALRVQLKLANPLVSTKVLSFLPSFIELSTNLQDHHALHRVRHIIQVLSPSLIAVLGDQRDRSREAAKGCIVQIAKAAASLSTGHSTLSRGSAQETPLSLFERVIIDSGLSSKVAKVKEQVLLLLPTLREASEKFPLKPFLPFLVDLLSDADVHVREASRSTVISLFSNAKATAKAELKKEMDNKGTRKQTADSILEQVFANQSAEPTSSIDHEPERIERKPATTSSHLPAVSAARPPSRTASRSTSRMGVRSNDGDSNSEIRVVYVATAWELEKSFAAMMPHFAGKETEHNWQAREQSILKIRGMLKTSTYQSHPNAFSTCIKNMSEGILKAVASLRTTLSIHGITLIRELAQQMGDDLEGQAETFLTALIRMAGFTKKIVATASQSAVGEILKTVSYRHKYLELVAQGLQDKNFGTRIAMCQHLDTILSVHGKHRKHALESHGGMETIIKFCKKALPDPNKDVRALAREAFYRVEQIWPAAAKSIFESLDGNTQKQIVSNRSSVSQIVPQTPAPSRVTASAPISMIASPRTPNNRVGPSSAILAAKRAAAASLRKEREEKEAIEARNKALMTNEDDDEEDLLSSPSVGELSEEELHSTPPLVIRRKPARSPSPSAAPPKSPLRSRESLGSTSPRNQPSSIPLPSSPVGNRSASRNENIKPSSMMVGARSRTTSTSSASSAGRFSARGSANYGSIAQRFDQQGGTSIPSAAVQEVKQPQSPMSSKIGQTIQPDSDVFDRSVRVSSPPLSPSRIPTRSPQQVTNADNTTTAMSFTSHARPGSDTSSSEFSGTSSPLNRSRLPRPVSMLPSPSPKSNVGNTSRHSHSLSTEMSPSVLKVGKPAKTRSTQPPPSNGNHTLLFDEKEEVSEKTEVKPIKVEEKATRPSRTIVSGEGSSSIKWFLSKADRLDNAPLNDQEIDFVNLSPVKRRPESDVYISQLHDGRGASLRTFKGLVSLSKEFKLPQRIDKGSNETETVLGLETDAESKREYRIAVAMWQEGNLFDRIFVALCAYLRSDSNITATSFRDLQTAALVSLHRLVENQFGLFKALDRERDLLDLLLDLVKKNHSGPSSAGVKSACQAIADRWADQTDVIIGVTTLRSVLSNWMSIDQQDTVDETKENNNNNDDSSPSTVAVLTLALRTLARLFGRLPAELIEEQMEHCSSVVKRGLHHRQIETRQQAVQVLVAANGKIRDPQSLFGILQPIDKAQQDLLIYYMNRA